MVVVGEGVADLLFVIVSSAPPSSTASRYDSQVSVS